MSRLRLAAWFSTAVLVGVVVFMGEAFARRLEVSSQEFSMVWPGTWTIFDEGGNRVSCEVTLDGSFHSRTLSKVSGQLVGLISNAAFRSCVNGSARALTETLPWHVQYNSFTGTLPSITSMTITIVGLRAQIENPSGIECLMTSTQTFASWIRWSISNGRVTEVTHLKEHKIPETGFTCSFVSPASIEGTGVANRGATLEAITIRLVQ